MYIFEIIKPGTWLTLFDDDSNDFKLENYIRQLTSHFYEANISLNLFIKEKEKRRDYNNLKEEKFITNHIDTLNIESETTIRNRVRKIVELNYIGQDPINTFTQFRDDIELEVEREKYKQTGVQSEYLIRLEVSKKIKSEYINYTLPDKEEKIKNSIEIELKRHKWKKGEIPQTFMHREIFIYAKAFIFSIDNFIKEANMLSKNPSLEQKISPLINELIEIFPDLIEIRNSVHHFEDRIRGKRHKTNIEFKPIDNDFIYAPNGGALILNQLNGNKYGCTLGDGNFGEVEISYVTMTKLQTAFQNFLNSLEWKGNIEILPD